MAFSNPSTKAAGSVLTAAEWNIQVANTDFLARPPAVCVTKSTDQSVAASVNRAIAWNTEQWDTDTMWSSTRAWRFEINTAGKYRIDAHFQWASVASANTRVAQILLNPGSSTSAATGSNLLQRHVQTGISGASMPVTLTGVYSFTSTQSVGFSVFQGTSAALTIEHSTIQVPRCSIMWVSS